MSMLEPFKKFQSRHANGQQLHAHQKACPRCRHVVHVDMARCPSCGHAPWRWNPNLRFLVITLIIAGFLLILVPLLTANEKSYRTPVIQRGP